MKKKIIIIIIRFETKLFTKKINGIVLGDMTRYSVYWSPQYSEARDNGVLLYVRK
jgi:hypothetical protein